MPSERFNVLETWEKTLNDWSRKFNWLLGKKLDDANILSTSITGIESTNVTNYGTFGNSSDYAQFDADGTLAFYGAATVFRDELQPLILQNYVSPAADITINSSEGTLEFKQSCSIADFTLMNIQINHDYKTGSALKPHVHWWQTSSDTPNWIIQYRWQYNGRAPSTTWVYSTHDNNAFTWTAGTLCQITGFVDITPTSDFGISSILQLRLIRDGDNDSSAFGSTDLVVGTISALSFDVHREIDSLGSRQEYIK